MRSMHVCNPPHVITMAALDAETAIVSRSLRYLTELGAVCICIVSGKVDAVQSQYCQPDASAV